MISFLTGLRQTTNSSAQSFNYYLTAIKSFCRWAVKNQRLTNNPVAHLDPLNTRTDRRHDRQTLFPEKLGYILRAASTSEKTFRGLSGEDRHCLYLLAMTSGLRVSELEVLTAQAFDLDSQPPTVTVPSAHTKNR
ncbi:MAG: hypothetical protein ACFCD0_21885 [Gemmataceae bacterium]